MKKKFLACATAMGMFLAALPIGNITAYAEDTGVLPSWIPTTLEESVDFYNQYGATHIEDGVVCVVFKESMNDAYYYEAVSTDDSCKLSREVYENNNTYSKYEVIAYRPKATGEFNVELNRTYNSTVLTTASYAFLADDSGIITETDIYGIIPDCITEYNDFKTKYGDTSIQENYIVYCDDINYSCGHSLVMKQNGTAKIKQIAKTDCSKKTVESTPAGNTSQNVYVYQAVSDGTVDISWKIGQEWNLDESVVSDIEKKYEVKDNTITDITNADEEQEWEIIGNSVYFKNAFLLGFTQEQLYEIDYMEEYDPYITQKTIFTPKSDGEYYVATFNRIDEKRSLEDGSHLHYIYNVLTNYTITVKDGIPSLKKEGGCSYYSESEVQEYLKDSENYKNLCGEENCCGMLYSENFPSENILLSYLNGCIRTDKYFISFNSFSEGSMNALIMPHIDGEAITVDGWQLNVNTVESSSTIDPDFTIATPDWFPNAVISVRWTLWEDPIEDGTTMFTVKDGDSTTCYAIDIINENFVPSTLRVVDVKGDLNGDGEFTIADVVILQDWLLTASDAELINWKSTDFCEDDVLDIYDLCLMKQELLKV